MRIAIAGGGIGGLAAAVALGRRGHEVELCERAARFGELGAGIQISANARRVLHGLGLAEAFAAIAVEPDRVVGRRWEDDRVLRTTPLGTFHAERYGATYANVARADLVDVLVGGVEALGCVRTRFGASVESATTRPAGGSPGLVLVDGTEIDADVVIGADGIHSRVRTALWGPGQSRFSGSVAYRALIPGDLVSGLPTEVTNRMGPDRHVVSYFIGPGRRHLNLVCIAPEAHWDVESWTEPASVEVLREAFVGWSPGVRELLDRVAEPIFRWALHDREPLPAWGRDGVTLLGDACHPMLPFMAQGACQAIEDAAVLAHCLEGVSPDDEAVDAALARYEAARRPRTAEIQTLSWRNRTTFHLPDGEEQVRRDAVLSQPHDPTTMDWLYGYDAATAVSDG